MIYSHSLASFPFPLSSFDHWNQSVTMGRPGKEVTHSPYSLKNIFSILKNSAYTVDYILSVRDITKVECSKRGGWVLNT